MLKKIKNNDFIWNALGLGLNSFNSLFFMIVVTRINGLEEAGVFTYAFSLACLFYFVSMYFNRPYQISNPNSFDFNSFFSTRIFTSLFSIIMIILFSLVSKFNIYKVVIIILVLIFKIIESISDCFYGYIHKNNELCYAGKSMTIKAILGIIIFFVFDLVFQNLIISLLGVIFINLIILLLFDVKKYYSYKSNKIRLIRTNIMKILKETFSIFAFSFLANLLWNLQKYVLTYYGTNEIQTIFGILIMPATVLSLVGNCIINPFIIQFNNHKNMNNISKFNNLLFKLIGIFGAIALFSFIVCYYLGIPILNFVYGVNLDNYNILLLAIIVASFFNALSNIISGCLTILNVNKSQFLIYCFSTICSILLSIFLISNYEVKGAIYAFCISMFIHFLLYLFLYFISANKYKKSSFK